MKDGSISARLKFVKRDDQVRKIAHESTRDLGNRCSSDRGRAIIHTQ
jgi:hypothetical protein